MSPVALRPVEGAQHARFVEEHGAGGSFLQTPAWGRAKAGWVPESLGWFDGDVLVGTALLLRRGTRIGRTLAYCPEGPVLDWTDTPVALRRLEQLATHARRTGSFALRVGPPVAWRSWQPGTVKAALADPARHQLHQVTADRTDAHADRLAAALAAARWSRQTVGSGFGLGQPHVLAQVPLNGRDEAQVLAAMNQGWRRNVRKATSAGVRCERVGADRLADFHRLYLETAQRDGFTPRPLAYFERMTAELAAEHPGRVRLYLAHDGDVLVAAALCMTVGRRWWYLYGASSTTHRDARGANAVQWRVVQDAIGEGADVYDLRGVTDTVDPDDSHAGLLRFKVGAGATLVEHLGEWERTLSWPEHRAFRAYLALRERRTGRRSR